MQHDETPGLKALKYVRLMLRAAIRGVPLETDEAEVAFVVQCLRGALSQNAEAFRSSWFEATLGEVVATSAGVASLQAWVVERGGSWWWLADWEPLVKAATKARLPMPSSAAAARSGAASPLSLLSPLSRSKSANPPTLASAPAAEPQRPAPAPIVVVADTKARTGVAKLLLRRGRR